MKRTFIAIVMLCLFVIGIFLTAQNTSAQKKKKPTTVQSVDLNKYAGTWYELARYPNKFQDQCMSNVSAEYVVEKDGDITVINKCKTANGETDEAKGEARIKDKKTNAKLEVRFAPKILSFIPNVWGDYWILDLGRDYEYALVGSPDRKYLWVLSRTPQIDSAKYESMMQIAKEEGFNPDKLVKTEQN
ncbi:MAG: lipocalin family protein [Pyrinomonadaceae bacterium]